MAPRLDLSHLTSRALATGLLTASFAANAGLADQLCLVDDPLTAVTNCTANDFGIQKVTITRMIDGCTGPGDTATINADVLLESGNSQRYDVGMYIAQDGGDAVGTGGRCFREALFPTGTPLNLLSGVGPYPAVDGDTCGDVGNQQVALRSLVIGDVSSGSTALANVTVACTDTDNDGFVDVGWVVAWDNNANTACNSVLQAVPGTAAKCGRGRTAITLTANPDYGDAPTGGTVVDGIARNYGEASHTVDGTLLLGSLVDSETAYLSSVNADGDDNNNLDDEDGLVGFEYTQVASNAGRLRATFTVTSPTADFLLQSWLDGGNGAPLNGLFTDSGESTGVSPANGSCVAAGANQYTCTVPWTVTAGSDMLRGGITYLRARLKPGLLGVAPTGLVTGGEVEDYRIDLRRDYGDAPDTYGTTFASNGASHIIGGVYLNVPPDAEPDGQPTSGATGDDNNGTDDEGGLFVGGGGVFTAGQTVGFFLGNPFLGEPGIVGPAVVSVWIDWNQDGDFLDTGEGVVINQPVSNANPAFTAAVPATALPGTTFARVRVTEGTAGSTNSNRPTGPAGVGEVEDSRVLVVNTNLDFGDAPDTYGTTLASNGARNVVAAIHLGVAVTDAEADAWLPLDGTGDDTGGATPDDEEGVDIPTLIQGQQATLVVRMSGGDGVFSGWFDWNQDGDFLDADEAVFVNTPLNSAVLQWNLPFTVPATAVPGPTYARFRLTAGTGPSTNSGSPTGAAGVGEVEDYQVVINLPPTLATVSAVRAYTDDSGQVQVEWTTEREVGTLSFELERWDETLEDWLRVTDEQVPALGGVGAPQGGVYSQVDDLAYSGETYRYRLIEEEVWGGTRIHGPFQVTVDGADIVLTRAQAAKARGNARSVAALQRGGKAAAESDEGELEEKVANGRFRAMARKLERHAGGLDASLVQDAKGRLDKSTRETKQRKGDGKRSKPTKVTPAALPEPVTRARLEVTADGLHQVGTAAIVAALGERRDVVRRLIQRGALALSSQGQPIAWEALDEEEGMRFHGEAPPENPYTARTVYWIERGLGTLMASVPAGVEVAVAGQTYIASEHFETDSFAVSDGSTDPESDYWRWAVMNGDASWNSFQTAFALHDLVPDNEASLRLDLQSIRDVGNEVIVSVNGTPLGETVAWDGIGGHSATLTVPANLLRDGDNTLRLEAQPGVGGTSYVYLDGFTLDFERYAIARGGALEVTAPASGPFGIDGFTDERIAVYRLGGQPVRLREVLIDEGMSGNRVSFAAVAGERYLAVQAGAETVPALEARTEVVFSPDEQVDYVVIADRGLAAGAEDLAAYRSASGLRTRVVFDDDIADAMSHGMASPHNLRAFLTWAEGNWGTRYAVLAGDACNDYKDVTGLCADLVSTPQVSTPYGLYACDPCLGDTDGDTYQDVQVSRIPAADEAALAAYLAKLRAYEAALPSERRVLLVADKADLSGDFAADSDGFAEQLALEAPDVAVEKLYLDEVDLTSAQATLKARLGEAGLWTNYLGHGGGTNLSKSSLLVNADTAAISGGSGVLNAMTCVVSLHDTPYFQSLSEALVLDADGGPVATVGPSGQSLNDLAVELNASLIEDVFVNGQTVMGDAVSDALQGHGEVPAWMRQMYNLIGDVYLRLP